jgi:TrmH family RNA methyltransferase
VVYLDGVRDPGNMGTLFRSAAGAGVNHLIIGPECVDPYHPKAVRAAMGAHLRIPSSYADSGEFADYCRDFPLVALADAGGNALYDSVSWQSASVMIVGGEAFGPTSESREVANVIVSIPLANGVESLNAGVAGSLLMFEAARQRRISLAT